MYAGYIYIRKFEITQEILKYIIITNNLSMFEPIAE